MVGRIKSSIHVTKASICKVMRPIRMSTLHSTAQESSSDSLLIWSLASQERSVMEQAVVGSEQMELRTPTALLILMQRRQLPALARRRLHRHLLVLHQRQSRRPLLHQHQLLTHRVIQSLPQTLILIQTRTPHRHPRHRAHRHHRARHLHLALNQRQLQRLAPRPAHLLALVRSLRRLLAPPHRQRQLHQRQHQPPRLIRATLIQTQTRSLSLQAIRIALLRPQVHLLAQVRAHRLALVPARNLIHLLTTLKATLCICMEPMRFSLSCRPRTGLSAPLATGLPSISTVRPKEASCSR